MKWEWEFLWFGTVHQCCRIQIWDEIISSIQIVVHNLQNVSFVLFDFTLQSIRSIHPHDAVHSSHSSRVSFVFLDCTLIVGIASLDHFGFNGRILTEWRYHQNKTPVQENLMRDVFFSFTCTTFSPHWHRVEKFMKCPLADTTSRKPSYEQQ